MYGAARARRNNRPLLAVAACDLQGVSAPSRMRNERHPSKGGKGQALTPQAKRSEHFDAAYYKRYYHDTRTAVMTREMQQAEVAFVTAFCRHIGLTIRRFADVGAGTGWWAKEFIRRYPSCPVVETFDASEAASRLYGHRRVPLQKLGGRESDLIVCRDVLRYLNNADTEKAIRRLARKCRGVLYLHVITPEDEIDEEMSDMSGFFRSRSWYRQRLRAAGFRDCGMGLFVSAKMKSFAPFAIDVR